MLPVIGTKEFIAWLPTMLGLGPGDTVLYPSLAYPTYDIGARLAGAGRGRVAARRSPSALDGGAGVGAAALGELAVQPDRAGAVRRHAAGRGRVGAVARLRARLRRVLHRARLGRRSPCRCCTRRYAATRSTGCSRCSRCPSGPTWPGYRAGFVTGDPALMKELLLVGRQAGMIVPGPGAGGDDRGAVRRRARGRSRRPGTRRAGRSSPPGSPRPGSASSTPRPGCTCGRPARASTAGRPASCSPPSAASSSAPGSMYGPDGQRATSGSR